jgi:hypothetical protein
MDIHVTGAFCPSLPICNIKMEDLMEKWKKKKSSSGTNQSRH